MKSSLFFVACIIFFIVGMIYTNNLDQRSEFLKSSEILAQTMIEKMKIYNLQSLAVSNIESIDGENNLAGEFISDRLIADLTKQSSTIQLVNREKMGQILEELDLKDVGILDKNTVITKGKMIGIDAIVLGKFKVTKNLLGNPTSLSISLELIDIEKGITIYANTLSIKDFGEVHPYCKK